MSSLPDKDHISGDIDSDNDENSQVFWYKEIYIALSQVFHDIPFPTHAHSLVVSLQEFCTAYMVSGKDDLPYNDVHLT